MEEKYSEQQSVRKTILHLAIPSFVAQLVSMLYNMVDRIYLGRIEGEGTMILAGLGLTLPIITIINAFANLVGLGGSPLVAIALGRKEKKEAEKILGNSTIVLATLSVFVTVSLLISGESLLYLLGATEDTIDYAVKYLRIYTMGSVFVMCSLGLNSFLLTQGFNKISMRNQCIGAVINIVLDPVLIYGFHLGIEGAAIATVISQGVCSVLILSFLLGKKTKIRLKWLPLEKYIVKKITALGFSTFFWNASESLVQIVFFRRLLQYGSSLDVTAMTLIFSISTYMSLPTSGIHQGAQPVISYSYGAGDKKSLKESIRMLILTDVICCWLAMFFVETFPEALFHIFTDDPEVIAIGVHGIRIYFLGRVLFGIHGGLQEMFRSIGYAKSALYIAFVRKGVLLIPLAMILPEFWGLGTDGVYLAEAITDNLTAVNAVIVFLLLRKTIFGDNTENSPQFQ